jgi:AraC-like DNA-binding protein
VEVKFRRHPVFFLADARQKPKRYGGSELWPGELLFIPSGSQNHQSSPEENHWCSMSLSVEDFPTAVQAVTGRDLALPTKTSRIRPPPQLMSRLLSLHKAARRLAATAPDILAHSEVARAIEQQSIQALVRCLTDGAVTENRHGRMPVMRRFERFLVENPGKPLYLPEICSAIGVSDRTLRLHCMEHLGMNPHRYLLLRRMSLARRALSRAGPAGKTVTQIATDHGFWELGRFAVEYRKLFGESPSATLRAPPDHPTNRSQDRQFGTAISEFA